MDAIASQASRLFTQPFTQLFIQEQIIESIKAPRIPHTKGQ